MSNGKPRVRTSSHHRISLEKPDPLKALAQVEAYAKANNDPNDCYAMPCQWILDIAQVIRDLQEKARSSGR